MHESLFSDHLPGEFVFLIIALGGLIVGKLAHKIKLPDISGQVILGIIIGPSGYLLLNALFGTGEMTVFTEHQLHNIGFFGELALGVMTFSIGTHLNYKVLHNSSKRIVFLALFDAFLTFSFVFSLLYFILVLDVRICLLLSAIAVETAPGTIISLIQKKYARGVFTKTLVGVVALNNFATILIFTVCKTISLQLSRDSGGDIAAGLVVPLLMIVCTVVFGVVVGWFVSLLSKHQHGSTDLFGTVFLAIFANILVCRYLSEYVGIGFSPLLVNLTMGVTYCNLSYHTKQVSGIFNNVTGVLFAVFFTLAGSHLDLTQLRIAGVAGALFIAGRFAAKWLAPFSVSKAFGFPDVIAKFLGLGLIPQAGLAVGLVISLSSTAELASIAPTISTIVLAAVAVNELIGPFSTAKSFDLAKETGQATPRLIDFLHEEYILMPLEAENKWDAIEQMTDFLVKTNHLRSITRDELLEYITAREKEFTTGLGNKLAIPHARIPAKEKLMGVIGICEKPIDFESIDNKPVDIVILIATPEGQENLHLKLLSAIARIFAEDPQCHDRLVSAGSPAEVYDLLQSKEVRNINSYLES